MARIVTVYLTGREPWDLRDMGQIVWFKFSEELARLGHHVNIATNEPAWKEDPTPVSMAPGLRRVPIEGLDWGRYAVVQTFFNDGFVNLNHLGGGRHPFIVAMLGSVVAEEDRPGIYFYGALREGLYQTQIDIHATARYITVVSPQARSLLVEMHGPRKGILVVEGAADVEIPPPGANPYESVASKVCIFAGNIYSSESQPEANRVLVTKLNALGKRLAGTGIRVVFLGAGDGSLLDPAYVTNLGSCSYQESWNYLQHAAVGLVVSAGPFMHNNESTKIYCYLRAGLPVVSEEGFPNDHVVRESGLGFVVPSEDIDQLAEKVVAAMDAQWDRDAAVRYILTNHTWPQRIAVMERALPRRDHAPYWYRWFRFLNSSW